MAAPSMAGGGVEGMGDETVRRATAGDYRARKRVMGRLFFLARPSPLTLAISAPVIGGGAPDGVPRNRVRHATIGIRIQATTDYDRQLDAPITTRLARSDSQSSQRTSPGPELSRGASILTITVP